MSDLTIHGGNIWVTKCLKRCVHQETATCEDCIGSKLFEPVKEENERLQKST